MCGIAGLIEPDGQQADRQRLARITQALAHRGPDDEGYYVDGRLGLGHRRLSIIDLSGGRQPMGSADGACWIVFNGEIYNYVELREELSRQGHRFQTQSDTEVLLRLYEVLGPSCVERLRGMFAFAIWDGRRRQLVLGRDRLGKKPLYYAWADGRLAFASEFAALLEDERIPRRLDPAALDDYLAFGYVPAPRTICEGVAKLPPAHVAVCRDGRLELTRYWSVRFSPKRRISEAAAAEEFLRRLREAVRLRLRSDVPLGVLLSGGVDSSVIAALAAEASGTRLQTFTIGFEEQAFNELPYAARVARYLGTDHHELVVRPNALEALPTLIRRYGEPFADSSAIPTYDLARMTRRHVTVALNGDGGDELLAGYERYWALRFSQRLGWLPAGLLRGVGRLAGRLGQGNPRSRSRQAARFLEALADYPDPAARYARWVGIFTPAQARRLYRESWRRRVGERRSWDWLEGLMRRADASDLVEQAMQADVESYLPGDLLVKMDIATMAHGLEVRSPLLDHELIEFAASLPVGMKLRGRRAKRLLRQLMRGRLPAEMFRRRKQGFGVPVGAWFRTSLRGLLEQELFGPDSAAPDYFDPAALRALADEHLDGRADRTHHLWVVLMFLFWHRLMVQGAAPGEAWRASVLADAHV